jgi:hypothetical protein
VATPALLAAALVASSPCTATDDRGRTFPTCFDPGRGMELSAGAAQRFIDGPGAGPALELGFGILWRTARESRSRKGSLWMMEHRFATVRGQPSSGLREATVTGWEGIFRRHLQEGFILVPTATPLRLPFPFDVAIGARFATWERRVYAGPGARVEVGQVALLLDPVRSPSGRFRLGLGPAMSYTLRTDGALWTHELSPFTSGVMDSSWETVDGHWSVRLGATAGWITVPGQGTFFRARGEASVERLVLAVNDQPVWLRASARAAERDAGAFRGTEAVASVGLVLRALN